MTTQATWEKLPDQHDILTKKSGKTKFLVGGILILAVVFYLIIYGTTSSARYFITVEELVNDPAYVGQTVRITGAVIGETIEYDGPNLIIDFNIAHIPEETDDLAHALYIAANDANSIQLSVHMENEVMPDLLQHEAQAILTGELGQDGIFYANELLLKCPSRYEEAVPGQSIELQG